MTGIVVGVDGSEPGAVAARFAAAEARLRGTDLVAVLVWDLFNQHRADGSRRFDPAYGDGDADAELRAMLEAALGPADAARIVRKTTCDEPAAGLLAAAADADLLVVGARGVGGFRGLLLGSVSQKILHHATVPVAVVRAAEGDAASAGPAAGAHSDGDVVVGVDGSAAGVAALRWALAEAAARGARVVAVHAWEPVSYAPVPGAFPYDDTAAVSAGARRFLDQSVDAALRDPATAGVTVERTVAPGGPATALLDAAEGAALVVVGRRGVGGFGRLLLGSVADHVARHAPCPVVVVPGDASSPPGP
jgi:nucleotide-binding universal stress UspA family protein